MRKTTLFLSITLACVSLAAQAEIVVPMNLVNEAGVGAPIGQITITESDYGLVLTPALKSLPPGLHGFHLHQNPDCSAKEQDGKSIPALGAGGHYDPAKTGHHGSPWGTGHLGDLPPLFVDTAGNASQAVLAPRLKIADLQGRSFIIHNGGDNHDDHPAPLGGGGARIVCGIAP